MTNNSPTIDLAMQLIAQQSVTPEDADCQHIMSERLAPLGFNCEQLNYQDVKNLWAVYGDAGPLFVFAGHTDVVPTGDLQQWSSDPFTPVIKDGVLYGRGAADMKGSLAAMITATEKLFKSGHTLNGRIGFLITSDEEGIATHGTVKVIEELQHRNENIDWCLVGEPSSSNKLGDIVKNGRRGSLGLTLTLKGKQGHIAYPHLAANPIHLFAPALTELTTEQWDNGNEFFPPTSFQVSNINSGTGATNVIPGECTVVANFRFSTESNEQGLKDRVHAILDKHDLDYSIDWNLSGNPFITGTGNLLDATQQAIQETCGYATELSTSGGTSDGRFIAPTGAQVIELGPINKTIHQIDEQVMAKDLDTLSDIYYGILQRLVCQ